MFFFSEEVILFLIFLTYFLLPLTHGAQGIKGFNLVKCGPPTYLSLVMIFCLKEDDTVLYRSLDTKHTYLGQGVCRGQQKYTEVFDPAMSKGHHVNKLIA